MKNKSIEKLDQQIDMLSKGNLVEKSEDDSLENINNVSNKIENQTENSDIMSSLITDDEKTKVFINKEKDNDLSEEKTKIMETINLGRLTFSQKKVEDIYLPIFLICLILMFLILIIVI